MLRAGRGQCKIKVKCVGVGCPETEGSVLSDVSGEGLLGEVRIQMDPEEVGSDLENYGENFQAGFAT